LCCWVPATGTGRTYSAHQAGFPGSIAPVNSEGPARKCTASGGPALSKGLPARSQSSSWPDLPAPGMFIPAPQAWAGAVCDPGSPVPSRQVVLAHNLSHTPPWMFLEAVVGLVHPAGPCRGPGTAVSWVAGPGSRDSASLEAKVGGSLDLGIQWLPRLHIEILAQKTFCVHTSGYIYP
jgi:hypothetical protein